MKRTLSISIFIVCLIGINLWIISDSNWIVNKKPSDEIFNPNLNVTKGSIIKYGYKEIEIKENPMNENSSSWSSGRFTKKVGDSYIVFGSEPNGETILFQEITKINLATDSLTMIKWIEEKDGLICSDFMKNSNGSKFFYIKGKKSGLIFLAEIIQDNLIVYFNFPDLNNQNRSNYRTITKFGSWTQKDGEGIGYGD